MKKLISFFILLSIIPCLSAQIIHVPGSGYPPLSIQQGINMASNGDTVLVAPGIYYENITFKGKSILLSSNFLTSNNQNDITSTIIDGSHSNDPDTNSVVRFVSGEGNGSTLMGFTIRGGKGTHIPYRNAYWGGGILCINAAPVIEHNLIINNRISVDSNVCYGGGIFVKDSILVDGVIIRHNTLDSNTIENIGLFDEAGGGGIYIWWDDNSIIDSNVFKGNSCKGGESLGGGIATDRCYSKIRGNSFLGNKSICDVIRSSGGGIYCRFPNYGHEIISNDLINNHAGGQSPSKFGGGIAIFCGTDPNTFLLYDPMILIDGNLINNNASDQGGGLFVSWSSKSRIFNNIISENLGYDYGGGVLIRYPPNLSNFDTILTIFNNTIVDNTCITFGGGGLATLTCGGYLAYNNIFKDNSAPNGKSVFNQWSTCDPYFYNNFLNLNNIKNQLQFTHSGNITGHDGLMNDSAFISLSSVCRDAGLDSIEYDEVYYFAPAFDHYHRERPIGAGIDIGAVERDPNDPVGIEKQLKDPVQVDIYPNPASSYVIIESNMIRNQSFIIQVYSSEGVLMHDKAVKSVDAKITLELAKLELPVGIYYVFIRCSEFYGSSKIVVVK